MAMSREQRQLQRSEEDRASHQRELREREQEAQAAARAASQAKKLYISMLEFTMLTPSQLSE